MPVTAKLSQAFYDRFGDDLANELVEWFNAVDATYRADLRDLNETNFARFDAKLEQRVVYLDAKIDRVATELESKLEQRFGYLDAKIDRVAAELNARVDRLEARFEQRFAELKAELLKWMFVFWATNLAALVALAAR